MVVCQLLDKFAQGGGYQDSRGDIDGWFIYEEAAVARMELKVRVSKFYRCCFAIGVARLFDNAIVFR